MSLVSSRSATTGLGFLFAGALTLARLGDLPLMDPDEGRNAEVAREMAVSGRWLVPTYNGLPYLDKPAFYFRLVATSLGTFGLSELAARLPSAFFALGLLGLVYTFSLREYGRQTALVAILVVASMPLYLAFGRIVIFDMALSFFVCAAIFAGYEAEKGYRTKRWYALGAAMAGLATLVKGPVGFILPVLVLVALAAAERRPGVLRRILHPRNLFVFCALVLPWFIGVSLERPDFPYYGLVHESFERFTTGSFSRTGPFYYYLPVIAGVCFAWSCLFPDAAILAIRRRSAWTRPDRLLLVWVIAVPAFFSISQSKLPGYVLTAVVALGILVARVFGRALEAPGSSSARLVRRGAVFLTFGALAVWTWLAIEVYSPETLAASSLFGGADYERARFLFPALLKPVAALALLALLASLTRSVPVTFATFLLVPVSLLTVSFPDIERYVSATSSARLAEEVRAIDPAATVVCLQSYPPGLAFYLRRELVLVTVDGRETTSNYIPFYLAREKTWPPMVVPVSGLDAWLETRSDALLFLAKGKGLQWLGRLVRAQAGAEVRELANGWRALRLPERRAR